MMRCDECGTPAEVLIACSLCGCMVCCPDEDGRGTACAVELRNGASTDKHHGKTTVTITGASFGVTTSTSGRMQQ